MVVKTASLRELKKLSRSSYKVLVTRYYPFWFKNLKKYINEYLPILAPSRQLLKLYKLELKRLKDPRLAWNITHFDLRFRREILHSSKALGELRRLKRISKELKGRRVVYLICHEPTDNYCHRRILKELIEKYNLGD